jgi:hypothetical protein
LGDEGETIMRKAIDLAKKGDQLLLKLCFERILPRAGRLGRRKEGIDEARRAAEEAGNATTEL